MSAEQSAHQSAINPAQKLELFADHWNPRIVAELNGQQIKLAKLKGAFVWHAHEHEDEAFLILHGELRMQFRDREVCVCEGELIVVPRGVEHRPVADAECHVLLFEPTSTVNTGTTGGDRTRNQLERL